MDKETLTTAMKAIKHDFMVFRNGMTADTLRKAGMPYSIIFGLNVPQLASIARTHVPSQELARMLWEDDKVRESRLLAAYLWPAELLGEEEAWQVASSVLTREEADILAFRLLKNVPYAERLATRLSESPSPLVRYSGQALRRNLS